VTIRPCDANETNEAWKVAISNRKSPTALLLTRQACPILDRIQLASAENLKKGAYILADLGKPNPSIIVMASGSEVSLIVEAGRQIADFGIGVRLVSFPSWELFMRQTLEYRNYVLPRDVKNG